MRRGALVAALVAAVAGIVPQAADAAKSRKLRGPRTVMIEVATIPVSKGVKMRYLGRTYTTDRRGIVRIPLKTFARARDREFAAGLTRHVRVVTSRLAPDVIAKFEQWRGRPSRRLQASLVLWYRVQPSFADLQGNLVKPTDVERVRLKSRTGTVREFRRAPKVWLPGTRVVAFDARLVAKPIEYSVEAAYIDGMNVVNRAQQRFAPARRRTLPISMLFYSARFTVKDALFGFPIGKSVRVMYPNGGVRKVPLERGQGTIRRLPRGNYDVNVAALGYSFTRPVAVSRESEVELSVISYLDLIVVAGTLLAIAVGLLCWGRPELRRFVVPRRRRPRAGAGAPAEGQASA